MGSRLGTVAQGVNVVVSRARDEIVGTRIGKPAPGEAGPIPLSAF